MTKSRSVAFFKSESLDYTLLFENHGYKVYWFPVFEFEFYNEELLTKEFLKYAAQGGDPQLYGIILTSPRSTEVVVKVLNALINTDWFSFLLKIRYYSVGRKTSIGLEREFGIATEGEKESKDAASLAAYICQHHSKQGNLCFVSGEYRREELPRILNDQGFQFVEINVYRAKGFLNEDLNLSEYEWYCFFSPKSFDVVAPFIKDKIGFKIAAIGQTTCKHIQTIGLPVHAVASTPCADSFLESIKNFDTTTPDQKDDGRQ